MIFGILRIAFYSHSVSLVKCNIDNTKRVLKATLICSQHCQKKSYYHMQNSSKFINFMTLDVSVLQHQGPLGHYDSCHNGQALIYNQYESHDLIFMTQVILLPKVSTTPIAKLLRGYVIINMICVPGPQYHCHNVQVTYL